ncbi:MAG: hypothetical protein ABSB95_05730 [Dissulfurispiraceae bacterium]
MGLRRRLYLLCIIAVSIMSFTGCVPQEVKIDSPLRIGEVTPYSMSKSQNAIYDDVRRKANYMSDEVAEKYIKSLFDSRTKQYGESVTFDYSGDKILYKVADSLKKALYNDAGNLVLPPSRYNRSNDPKLSFDYNVANGHLIINTQISRNFEENNEYYHCVFYWAYLCNAAIEIALVPDGRTTYLSLNEFTTSGQETVTASNNTNKLNNRYNLCNREQFITLMNSTANLLPKPESIVEEDYNSYVAQIAQEAERKLNNRYSVRKGSPFKTEKTYNVSFEVAVGRLQRSLNKYKYEKENSTFSFEENVDIKGKSQKRNVLVRLFPEMKNKVAVAIDMTYDVIVDSMSDNMYGEKEARSSFESTINYLNSLLRES